MPISATTISTSISSAALLSECADLIESMLHRFLKTESQKPTPPTPAELQPAVNTLWRLSSIRKNLAQKNPPTSPTSHISHILHPENLAILSHSSPHSSSAPTSQQIAKLALELQREVRARLDLQSKMNFPAPAQPSPPPQPTSESPPKKFPYPPPKRTSV